MAARMAILDRDRVARSTDYRRIPLIHHQFAFLQRHVDGCDGLHAADHFPRDRSNHTTRRELSRNIRIQPFSDTRREGRCTMTQLRIPLEVLKIENPCPADWNAMAGDERKRFCQGCQKHVHNLSTMPREEAERLVCESAGNLCVRMALNAEGKFVTVGY